MNKLISILFLCVIGQAVVAQPAVYQNGTLTVPNAAVITESGSSYFADIELQADADGNFGLLSAVSQSLVAIDSVAVSVMESLPVQVSVTVNGNKSVPCVQLLEPAVVRTGTIYTVVLAESRLGPAETCIAMIDPFETTIALDVQGLAAGDYEVNVNGTLASFTLANDN